MNIIPTTLKSITLTSTLALALTVSPAASMADDYHHGRKKGRITRLHSSQGHLDNSYHDHYNGHAYDEHTHYDRHHHKRHHHKRRYHKRYAQGHREHHHHHHRPHHHKVYNDIRVQFGIYDENFSVFFRGL